MWGLHPETGAVDQLMAMEHLIPPGQKKVAKVYTAACHPLLPHLVAVAANSGQPATGSSVHINVSCQEGDSLARAHSTFLTHGAGVAFLSFDIYDMPPVHALPLGRTSEDLVDEEGNPTQGTVRTCMKGPACGWTALSRADQWLASTSRAFTKLPG